MENAQAEFRHPLEVQPLSSEKRFKQPKHEIFAPLPCKAYYVAPSSGGKSSAAIQAINSLWDCWDKVVIFAATVEVDSAFDALKERAKKLLVKKGEDPDDPDNEVAFDSLEDLPRVMHMQAEKIKEERSLKRKQLSQLCILIDDHLGSLRHDKHLDMLHSRGRHIGCSVFLTSQIFRGASTTIRKNIDFLACFRLPAQEYVAVASEVVGSMVNEQQFRELYSRATSQPHSFLFIKLKAKDAREAFFRNYTTQLIPN